MHLHCNLNFGPDFLLDRVRIRKNFLYKVCSPKYQLPFSCLHFYIHSSYFWRKMSLNLAGQRNTCFRRLFSVKPTLRPVLYHHMADEHRRALLPACVPAAYLTRSPSRRRTRAAVALPRVYASCRRVHWPSVVALPEHTTLSSRRLPMLELDAIASLFKARCADPSPHRCLKHAPALPSPPYLDNQQSTRAHPIALNLLPPPLCANRCRASLQAKRALLPPLCSLVSIASAHCPFLTPFVRREQASHRSFCLSSAATPSLSQPSFLVK